MATDYVFVGPSLPAAEARRLLPGCQILPPVRHGDLLRLRPSAGDRLLIIDGLFLQTAPVRHKEILLALSRRAIVAGSSSMGALRAAELWPYGMRGVGEVFRLHRDLVVTSDDEVAVIHCSAEEGYRPLSEPLVNIRIALGEASAAGVISASEGARLLALAQAMPFRSRSFRLLSQVAAGELGPGLAGRFDSWRRVHARDAKADDARLLLRMAAAGDPELCPAGPGDTPVLNARTHHTEAWALKFHGTEADGEDWVSDADVTVAIMLLHPGFPGRHRLDVLARLGGTSWDDPRAVDLALAAARQRGLDERSAAVPGGWLTPRERSAAPPAGQLATILARAFGTVSSYRVSARTGGSLLADGAVRDWGLRVARAASRCNRLLPGGAHRRLRYRDEVVDRLFAREWQCAPGDFEAAVWDRGISSVQEFRRLAEPFAGYLKAGIRLASPQPGVTGPAGARKDHDDRTAWHRGSAAPLPAHH